MFPNKLKYFIDTFGAYVEVDVCTGDIYFQYGLTVDDISENSFTPDFTEKFNFVEQYVSFTSIFSYLFGDCFGSTTVVDIEESFIEFLDEESFGQVDIEFDDDYWLQLSKRVPYYFNYVYYYVFALNRLFGSILDFRNDLKKDVNLEVVQPEFVLPTKNIYPFILELSNLIKIRDSWKFEQFLTKHVYSKGYFSFQTLGLFYKNLLDSFVSECFLDDSYIEGSVHTLLSPVKMDLFDAAVRKELKDGDLGYYTFALVLNDFYFVFSKASNPGFRTFSLAGIGLDEDKLDLEFQRRHDYSFVLGKYLTSGRNYNSLFNM